MNRSLLLVFSMFVYTICITVEGVLVAVIKSEYFFYFCHVVIPKFECSYIQKSPEYAANAKLHCKVLANPVTSNVYWKFNMGGATLETIKPNDPKKHGITASSWVNTYIQHIA